MDKVGSVLIIGGGIGGTQAALDLAESGFKVYVAEKTTAIGGVMSQLDKTFPTNDCAICIVSPKLVTAGRHPNIELIINSEIGELKGEAGNFQVTLNKKSLYIDEEKCTGCGACAQECPIEYLDSFNEGVGKCKAISVKYPQAVPLVYSINKALCIGCGICKGVCKAEAISYPLEDTTIDLNVGSIILSPGFDEFDPTAMKVYGYGKYKNVVSSIEFERILSASGPYGGRILRPSDGDLPKKIAFLQCVGSRDARFGKEYCSSVCCMYTAKEATIAKEHEDLVEPTIFYMDIRAYGKDFDKYIERGKKEYGLRYINARISMIEENPETKDLILTYESAEGKIVEEDYQMVVLSVGFDPPVDARKIADTVGIELNEYGFATTKPFSTVETTKPGIYVCGVFSQPKDIPETVIEASAAAGFVNTLLAPSRGKLITKKEYPPEIEVKNKQPRIGVFICHCGINIGGFVDVPQVTEYAGTLPNVVLADRNLYTCSADTQEIIKDKIKEMGINRVVVASCTPRTHEPLFQDTIREAGLNRYLFQMTNIRDQCSWVHMHEPENATEKAKDLVRMAIAKASRIEALESHFINITPKALVIGGGIAGMNAALNLSNQGYETYIVEKNPELGGFSKNIYHTLEGNDVQQYLQNLKNNVSNNPNIKVFTNAQMKEINGYVGNFESIIASQDGSASEETIEHGVIILATGALEYEPSEYLYNQDPRVITQTQLEKMMSTSPDQIKQKKVVTMIQCVGSRNEEHPYCSRICCAEAVKNAIKIKEINPETEIFVLFRDLRTYGFKEKYYKKARELGVIFIRFDEKKPPELDKENDNLVIKVKNQSNNELSINPDLLILSTGMVMPSENKELAMMLKVPLNDDKFFLEAHVKLRPVDFATEGIFLAGTAHGPANIDESIAQANAAVSRAITILSKDVLMGEGVVSHIDGDKCTGCNICVRICPYNAIVKDDVGVASVLEALCKGCGVCAATCPEKAITVRHFTNDQIYAEILAFGEEMK